VHWVATECSQNDGSKTQYYVVILDWLQGRSRGLERAPESWIRGPLTITIIIVSFQVSQFVLLNLVFSEKRGTILSPEVVMLVMINWLCVKY